MVNSDLEEQKGEALLLMTLYDPERLNAWVNGTQQEQEAIDLQEGYKLSIGVRKHVMRLLAELEQEKQAQKEREKQMAEWGEFEH